MRNIHISAFEQYIIDRVREIRKAKKVSQKTLAYMIDVSPPFIGAIESPKRPDKWKLDHLNKIAVALGVSPKDFMPDTPIKE